MTAPLTPTSQGALQLASAYRLHVNAAYDQDLAVQDTPEWVAVYDIIDFAPAPPEYSKQDTTTYDNADPTTGIVTTSQRKVSQTRVLSGQRLRIKHSAPEDNVGWQTLQDGSRNNRLVQARWFNASDPDELAEVAVCDCTYTKNAGGPADRGVDAFTLELQEVAQDTANPSGATVLPNATSATPNTGPAGTSVVIAGTGFSSVSGATGVKFGSTNAALYTVDSATQITAVVPVGGAAGAQNILVTNAAGADTTPVSFTKS